MIAPPVFMPDTMPDIVPTVAIIGLLLLQVPPVVTSDNVVVDPTHKIVVPVIADGKGFTVTVIVTLHPPPGV
jgi:hypothetical protein